MRFETCNTVSFTLDRRVDPETAKTTLFRELEHRGAFFTSRTKTEWQLNVPIRFPVGPFIDTLAEDDWIYWLDPRTVQRQVTCKSQEPEKS